MIYYKTDYLMHHGILGQKWGVRRFQNEDGSLTKAGRSRYSRGADIYREHSDYETKEYGRLKKTSKAYQKAEKESNRIAKKYGLDADDGGGGDTERFDTETLRRAGDRYWQIAEDMAALDDMFSEKARKYADKQIIEKYGDIGLKDMEHFQNVNGIVAVTALMAVVGGISLYSYHH